jgi:hypothetical protein
MLMRYVARRGKVGLRVAACLGGLLSILFANGCSDGDRTPDEGGADGGTDGKVHFDALSLPWRPVPVDGTLCRDGTGTGYAINLNPASRKLLIYLEGGGACFNELSCLQNPESWPPNDTSLMKSLTRNWIMSRTSDNSPFKDWNLVYIPYCSGDVHTGSAMSGYNGEPQVGFQNYKKDLADIIPQVPNLEQVVLTGVSAGGFGVAWNWMWTQDAFGSVPVFALDDSGPPMGPEYLAECQQQKYHALWNWTPGLHPACTECDIPAGKVVRPLLEATLRRRTSTRMGLLSYDEDGTIKQFFSYGVDNCVNWDAEDVPAYPYGKFSTGLAELRQAWAPFPQVAAYVVNGGSHTFLSSDIASVKTGTSISMLEWINKLITQSDGWTNVAP